MSGTIICAVDNSGSAGAAVQVARRLAERFGARILLVGFAGGFAARGGNGDGLSAGQARADATRQMERIAGPDDLSLVEQRVAEGDEPAEALAVIAAEEAADLIVVGARRGLFGRTLRTAFAQELAETAPCPVVVAPPEAAGVVVGRLVAERLRQE